MTIYRSLDRSTRSAIFLASLLVTVALFSSVASAFGPIVTPTRGGTEMEEVVVEG